MNTHSLITSVLVSLVSISTVACSSDPEAAGGAPGAASGAQGVNSAELEAACTANYDAMIVRFQKCGERAVMGVHPFEASRHSYMKLCSVQGSRSGTGYTAAFRTKCADVMATATCTDLDAVVKSCWEPKGDFARGLPCSSDNQCKDGLCALPVGATSGTSCGVCGMPILKSKGNTCEPSSKDKCEPGTLCGRYSNDGDHGHSCHDELGYDAPPGTYKQLGKPCEQEKYDCTPGTYCASNNTCTVWPGEGDSTPARCDSWTTPSATGKCVVREALSCN
jgi:hypothetical protein